MEHQVLLICKVNKIIFNQLNNKYNKIKIKKNIDLFFLKNNIINVFNNKYVII